MNKVLKKIVTSIFLLSSLVAASASFADEVTEVSRYTTVKNQATRAQINPLLMTVQVKFPQSVQTVGDAMDYLLRYSGYSLVNRSEMDVNVQQMLDQPLPIVDRSLGPLSLQEALEVLAGKHVFKLTEDPLHRKLSFEVLPDIKNRFN